MACEVWACQTNPADWWFPADSGWTVENDEAVALCKVCPNRVRCAELGVNEIWGVWGGTTPRERARERARVRWVNR